jgi:aryl-alcohol dehydrogenase
VLGHEGAGIVEAVGWAVSKVRVGDPVVLTFRSCGRCGMCQRGEPAYCVDFSTLNFSGRRTDGTCTTHLAGACVTANFFGQSSFAQYALASERNIVRLPADVPVHLMGPLGCGVQTGAGSIMRSMACPAGSSVAILGGGSVGLSAVLGAVIMGCSPIVVCEPIGSRRDLALSLGATHVIDPIAGDLAEAILQVLPSGADYVLDTTARPDVVTASLRMLGRRGVIGLTGVPSSADASITLRMRSSLPPGAAIRSITEGDSDPDKFIPEMVNLFREGRFPFDRLITTYALDDINRAIADQHSGKIVKAVLLT